MDAPNKKIDELVRQLQTVAPDPNESRRFHSILSEQGIEAAFANGLSLPELCDFLEKIKDEALAL